MPLSGHDGEPWAPSATNVNQFLHDEPEPLKGTTGHIIQAAITDFFRRIMTQAGYGAVSSIAGGVTAAHVIIHLLGYVNWEAIRVHVSSRGHDTVADVMGVLRNVTGTINSNTKGLNQAEKVAEDVRRLLELGNSGVLNINDEEEARRLAEQLAGNISNQDLHRLSEALQGHGQELTDLLRGQSHTSPASTVLPTGDPNLPTDNNNEGVDPSQDVHMYRAGVSSMLSGFPVNTARRMGNRRSRILTLDGMARPPGTPLYTDGVNYVHQNELNHNNLSYYPSLPTYGAIRYGRQRYRRTPYMSIRKVKQLSDVSEKMDTVLGDAKGLDVTDPNKFETYVKKHKIMDRDDFPPVDELRPNSAVVNHSNKVGADAPAIIKNLTPPVIKGSGISKDMVMVPNQLIVNQAPKIILGDSASKHMQPLNDHLTQSLQKRDRTFQSLFYKSLRSTPKISSKSAALKHHNSYIRHIVTSMLMDKRKKREFEMDHLANVNSSNDSGIYIPSQTNFTEKALKIGQRNIRDISALSDSKTDGSGVVNKGLKGVQVHNMH